MANEINVTDLRKGDRITLDYGCMHGTESATVVGVESTRWGWHAELVKEDGTAHRISGSETLRGIGWKRAVQVSA